MSIATEISRLQTAKSNIKTAIENKGVNVGNVTLDEYASKINEIPTGGSVAEVEEKDANFYDYDGTLLYSYTKGEFLELEEMPANPSHNDLVADGWNWSLTKAKTFTEKYGAIDIGQQYHPSDDKTHIFIDIPKDAELKKTISVGVAINGVAYIDWGDGSEIGTLTGDSLTTSRQFTHTYSSEGQYEIKLWGTSVYHLFSPATTSYNQSFIYRNYNGAYYQFAPALVAGVYVGTWARLSGGTFSYFRNMRFVTIPKGCTIGTEGKNTSQYAFAHCGSLNCLILPIASTKLESNVFYQNSASIICPSESSYTISGSNNFANTSNLKRFLKPVPSLNMGFLNSGASKLILEDGTTVIASRNFDGCYNLNDLNIPSSVTSISTQAFQASSKGSTCWEKIDFSQCKSVPALSNVNAFGNLPDYAKIVVPDELYEDWIAATNWSSYASKIVKESEYNG